MKRLTLLLTVLCICLAVSLSGAYAEGEGQALYDKKCAMCHGKDGVAKKMAAGSANFNDPAWQESSTVESILTVTSEGKGKMKSYKDKLTPDELEMIAKYIKTLK